MPVSRQVGNLDMSSLPVEGLHAVQPGLEGLVRFDGLAKGGEKSIHPQIGIAGHTEGARVACARLCHLLIQGRKKFSAGPDRAFGAHMGRTRGLRQGRAACGCP